MTSLDTLKIGQKAIIKEIKIKDKAKKRHLLDMGLTKGTEVEVRKIAPTGDPVDIFLRDYELFIRKEDLKQILVEVIDESSISWKSK